MCFLPEFDCYSFSDFDVTWIRRLTAGPWPEASLSEHPAGCERRTGQWGWGWGWATWPLTGWSSGLLPDSTEGRLSGLCSSEPAAPPHRMCSAPSSWRRAAVTDQNNIKEIFELLFLDLFWLGTRHQKKLSFPKSYNIYIYIYISSLKEKTGMH